jgi:hypothetical protein
MIVSVLLRERNYATLVSIVDPWMDGNTTNMIYNKLFEQRAYDTMRTLIKENIQTPINFIEMAIPTGQLDLVKHAHFSYPGFMFGSALMLNTAIETGYLDVIKFVHEIMKNQYSRFRVTMLDCVLTKKLEIVKFGYETFGRNIMCSSCIVFALKNNLLDILEFLIDTDCPVDYLTKRQLEEQHPELGKRFKKREERRGVYSDDDCY